MTARRYVNAGELAVLESLQPDGLTPPMRDVARCLFEALVVADPRAGSATQPTGDWLAQLERWAAQSLQQLQHLADEIGGGSIYLAKGVAVHLTARDREMCARFRGNNYRELARSYGVSEMRVRQVVGEWQRQRYLERQHALPGLDMER